MLKHAFAGLFSLRSKRQNMEIFWLITIVLIAVFSLWVLKALFSIAIKLLIAALVIFVLFAAFAHGAESKIYEGYVFSGQSITVDSKPFIINFEFEPGSITLNYNQKYFFISNGKCQDIMNLKFCFGNYIYDTDKKKDKVNISVYSVAPDIAITRTINSSELIVGQETEISLNVTNGEGIAAENFTLIDSYSPDEFIVSDVGSVCSNINNSVYYHGFLREKDYIRCPYRLTPLKEVQRATRAKVSYYDGAEMKDIFSQAISFDVSPFFAIKTQFNETDKKVSVGNEVIFSVNFTNTNPDFDVNINSLDIVLPSGLQAISTYSLKTPFNDTANTTIRSQNVELSANRVHFSGKLDTNETKFIIVRLKAVKSGSSNIFVQGNYSTDETSGIVEVKDSLEVENPEVSIYTNFKDGETFDSGEEKYFQIGVINPSDSAALKNVKVRIDSPIYNFSAAEAGTINKTSSKNVVNQRVVMPDTQSDRDISLNVTVYYDNEFGESFQKTFEYTIRAEATKGLVISHEFSDTTVEEGKEITVKTKIESRRNVDLKDVRVFDVLPIDFTRKGLNSVSNVNINGLDTVTVYEYKLTAPQVSKDKVYKMRTTATYVEDNKTYAYEKEDEITVTRKKLSLSISSAVSDQKPYMGEILDILYTVSNPEDEQLKSIVARFPVQEMIELVGEKNFSVGTLEPGESFTIKDAHRIRAKANGSMVIAPSFFTYEDAEGDIFTANSSELSFSPNFGYIAGPAFTITQSAPERVKMGDSIKVSLLVRNIGTEAGSVNVIDGESSWIFNLRPGEDESASYTFGTVRAGQFNVKPLKGEYYYIGKKIYTISNDINVTVFKEEGPVAVEVKAPEKEIVVEQAVVKKTFFDIVLDTIKQIFALFKR